MRTITNVMQEKPSVLLRRAATTEKEATGTFGIDEVYGSLCSWTYLAIRAGLSGSLYWASLAEVDKLYGLPEFVGDKSICSYITSAHDSGGFLRAAEALEAIGY